MNPSDYGDHPQLPTIKIHHPSSPHHPTSTATPTAGARRRIGVAVDLSEESAFAVRWAVQDYIRAEDAVLLLHVSPTSVLYGADWGPLPHTPQSPGTPQSQKQLEDDFDAFTASKVADLAKPLKEAGIPFKIHIVKDHDMRERLCLEVERLGLSAVIMGSRGFGAEKRGSDGKLGSVSDYCVHHCVCPVVVVRCPEDKEGGNGKPVVTVKEAEVEAESGKG
ncbi:Adenine nucleotide alpha hydrolases-like superfamily protein isoform 2 [Hibiscus syriacus]|uniref:Adenine nucleotide alpha hydrolases-like superfamily protein isoform 2 n=1 Tax=Hibiscus syriacus TaxID=106335 RepID=A0A6A2YNZ4_HIBSY|nr:Adenine nucleotide alpha hydrolases-like superfamily protein isoform 2 [Hibiscus syriacus]